MPSKKNNNQSYVDQNLKCFIAFRVFFNARFYYPVLAVLFIDFGLTMEQYALLNVAWAMAIVTLEVPSGALADLIGRKRMVVIAAFLMVIEMCFFCFAPMGNQTLLFIIFLINRIISGAAEASASGADEALAYDSLVEENREKEWPEILAKLMRWQSIAFVFAMIIGAAVYDPLLMQTTCNWLQIDVVLEQKHTLRIPLFLTLCMSIITCIAALRMREPRSAHSESDNSPTLKETFLLTFQAGKWILKTPLALVIILTGMFHDSLIRLMLTISSSFYRLIQVPEAAYGLLGALFSALGFFVPRISKKLVKEHSLQFNFTVVAAIALLGFVVAAFAWRIYGFISLLILGVSFFLLNFFLSHYLNTITPSHQRATVLSFKGLALNLAYGFIGLLFAAQMRYLTLKANADVAGKLNQETEDIIFAEALTWFPWYFAGAGLLLFLYSKWKAKNKFKEIIGT